MRPPPLTLARIPVGRHTVVGADRVPGGGGEEAAGGGGGGGG